MPDCLAPQHGKYLTIEGVRFAYGHEQLLAALDSNAEYARYRREHGEKAARATSLGQAISYRFKRDGKGWRVFATTNMMEVPVVTDQKRGAIGVDLNGDHGRRRAAFSVSLVTCGKSLRPSSATPWPGWLPTPAKSEPIVIEKLDFRQKLPWKVNPAVTAGCCPVSATARSRRISCPVATGKEWKCARSTRPSVRLLAG